LRKRDEPVFLAVRDNLCCARPFTSGGSGSCVAKAEWTKGAANPRFVVTSLNSGDAEPQRLYEEIYGSRGDMETASRNVSSICSPTAPCSGQGRLSAATMRANQLRLWFASMANVLLCALRRLALSTPNSPRQPAARSASNCSRSAR
jgi:hypothetical protein